jgi:hypothetical protein
MNSLRRCNELAHEIQNNALLVPLFGFAKKNENKQNPEFLQLTRAKLRQ